MISDAAAIFPFNMHHLLLPLRSALLLPHCTRGVLAACSSVDSTFGGLVAPAPTLLWRVAAKAQYMDLERSPLINPHIYTHKDPLRNVSA